MNIGSLIEILSNLRSWLDDLGVTREMLLGAALVSTLVAVVSLREVLHWFLKLNRLENELQAMRTEVRELHRTLEQTRALILSQIERSAVHSSSVHEASEAKSPGDSAPIFRFDN